MAEYPKVDPMLRLKYQVAEELGLLPQVIAVGWAGLPAQDTGRVGGIVARRAREMALGRASEPQ